MVAKLKLQLSRKNRALYGVFSEQFDVQGTLLDAPRPEPIPTPRIPQPEEAANARSIDRSLPAHLPRQTETHRPPTTAAHYDAEGLPCGCAVCGGRLRLVGTDVSEQLEFVPAHFKVIRHVRSKLACVACETIVQAAAPGRPIARGIAGPALLAHVMTAKKWVARASELLDPLVAALGP